MTNSDPIKIRMTEVAMRLLSRTVDGQISWAETDKENEFIYSGISSSTTIRRRDVPTAAGMYVLAVINWRGTLIEALESELDDTGFVMVPAEWNKVLSDLYEVARRNALDIGTVLDALMDELGGNEETDPPPQ